jgi:phosphoribosyl-ATP pyrophosphohydrolase
LTFALHGRIPARMDILDHLENVIAERSTASPDESYVAKLNTKGMPTIARKLGEEGVEAAVAALSGSDEELVGEAADIIFHLLVALQARGLSLADVKAELERREGVSGLVEKASRSE